MRSTGEQVCALRRLPGNDGAAHARCPGERIRKLCRHRAHFAHRGIFFEDHFAVPVGVNLQRVTAADNTDIENLVLLTARTLDNAAFFAGFDA